jgi:5-enolpyruvylshikimate-3-phosphate synthase
MKEASSMAETKEKSVVDSISNDDTIKELETLGTKIHNIIKSDDYKNFLKITEDLNKKLITDNEKINKTGKSEYTFEQRTLISAQVCAMGNIDAALGTLMNILDLRYREEVRIAAIKAAENTEDKKDA